MNPSSETCVMANPLVVLREEFDDWAILFDPDTGSAFGINPIGVMVWKLLDGCHTLEEIVQIIREAAEEVPPDVAEHIQEFVRVTVEFGLAGHKAV